MQKEPSSSRIKDIISSDTRGWIGEGWADGGLVLVGKSQQARCVSWLQQMRQDLFVPTIQQDGVPVPPPPVLLCRFAKLPRGQG